MSHTRERRPSESLVKALADYVKPVGCHSPEPVQQQNAVISFLREMEQTGIPTGWLDVRGARFSSWASATKTLRDLDDLPATLTAYRGARRRGRFRYSWTTHQAVAEQYARNDWRLDLWRRGGPSVDAMHPDLHIHVWRTELTRAEMLKGRLVARIRSGSDYDDWIFAAPWNMPEPVSLGRLNGLGRLVTQNPTN